MMTTITTNHSVHVSKLSIDELSSILSFIKSKELIKSTLYVSKLFLAAIYHGNTWNYMRLSSRQLFKCKNDIVFSNFVKYSWNNLRKFSFMVYKKSMSLKQKKTLANRLFLILKSCHNSLCDLQLHGVDISLFNNNCDRMKSLNSLKLLWIISAKRETQILQSVWNKLISSNKLITFEFMSNHPLNISELKMLQYAFKSKYYILENIKLSVLSTVEANKETMKLINILSLSLKVIFISGMKYIDNDRTNILNVLCKCSSLIVLHLMYRNINDTRDLYNHIDVYDLLYGLSFSLHKLKVLSLEYGPSVDYNWNDKCKDYIKQNFKSLIWVKFGQNRIKNPFLSTVITPNVKCNRFCLSWNANV